MQNIILSSEIALNNIFPKFLYNNTITDGGVAPQCSFARPTKKQYGETCKLNSNLEVRKFTQKVHSITYQTNLLIQFFEIMSRVVGLSEISE